jgi:SAM-dependent methyltransferase
MEFNYSGDLENLLSFRSGNSLTARLWRAVQPPLPLLPNPAEHRVPAPIGRFNLYVGGAGSSVPGYVNVDLFAAPGVDVRADAARLPFPDATFTRIECDAVLEHVPHPEAVAAELTRVLAPGGILHLVVPFCHPYHAYPEDYRRFTLQGLLTLTPKLEPIAQGWRTGPTATLLIFLLEYAKLWFTTRWIRAAIHLSLGWLLFPLRYLDLLAPPNTRIGNHAYVWLRKPPQH